MLKIMVRVWKKKKKNNKVKRYELKEGKDKSLYTVLKYWVGEKVISVFFMFLKANLFI